VLATSWFGWWRRMPPTSTIASQIGGGLKKTGSSRMQPVSNKLDRFFIPLNDRFMNQSEKILRTARLTLG
jgi:hypothetical protein